MQTIHYDPDLEPPDEIAEIAVKALRAIAIIPEKKDAEIRILASIDGSIMEVANKFDTRNEIAERTLEFFKHIADELRGIPDDPETNFLLKISDILHGQTGLLFPGKVFPTRSSLNPSITDNSSTVPLRKTRAAQPSTGVKRLRNIRKGS